jgi:hypothetical protein
VTLRVAILAALALSCVHGPTVDVPVSVTAINICEHARRPLPPPPEEPEIDWMPSGCPSRFGACLSGGDAMRMLQYMHAVNRWKRSIARTEVAR